MRVIHAPGRDWGACISCGRDACAGAGMSCPGRAHESTCFLWPAVLAIGLLCISEAFICMSYDWDIIVIVHMHRSPIMFKVQFVISSNWTEWWLQPSIDAVFDDVDAVQRYDCASPEEKNPQSLPGSRCDGVQFLLDSVWLSFCWSHLQKRALSSLSCAFVVHGRLLSLQRLKTNR